MGTVPIGLCISAVCAWNLWFGLRPDGGVTTRWPFPPANRDHPILFGHWRSEVRSELHSDCAWPSTASFLLWYFETFSWPLPKNLLLFSFTPLARHGEEHGAAHAETLLHDHLGIAGIGVDGGGARQDDQELAPGERAARDVVEISRSLRIAQKLVPEMDAVDEGDVGEAQGLDHGKAHAGD